MKHTRNLRHILSIIALLAITENAGAASPAASAREATERLQSETGGAATVSFHRTTGVAQMVRLAPDSEVVLGNAKSQGLDFLVRHGALFGVEDPYRQLIDAGRRTDRLGNSHSRFLQVHKGVPVFGGELRAHFDPQGRLTAMNGVFVPDPVVNPNPTVTGANARAVALSIVAKQHNNGRRDGLEAGAAQLFVYRSGLLWGRPGADHLVWRVEVGNGSDIREFLFVDAHDGTVVEQITGIHHMDRVVHHGSIPNPIWQEGDPTPFSDGDEETNDEEINSIIEATGGTYELFLNLSGGTWHSWDGEDATMEAIAQFDDSGEEEPWCPNAAWNGEYTRFCENYGNDDVVAHEWTHAYTDYTHNLVYQWQPGALNESFSDIFGETVDLLNSFGNDSPGDLRAQDDCTPFASPVDPTLIINSPASVAGPYTIGPGAPFNPPGPISVTAQLELVDDGTDPDADACSALVGFTPGRIALIDRGDCTFVSKAQRAQDAGAAGVIIANNEGDVLVGMVGVGSLDILSVFVTQSDGETLKAALDQGVEATLELEGGGSDLSVRWLIGEDFSAIRDMWNPNCVSDPAKVKDDSYHCILDDSGGVHTNSGVPNHGYALLVDGGSYNGHTVAGIGLTRAAHIYWRAMSAYQVDFTDFAIHADALEQSCQDLIGQPLTDLITGAVSAETITANDCAQLAEAIAAVELRRMPDCEFPFTVLDQDPPPIEGSRIGFYDGFDGGPLPGWSVSNQGVNTEYVPRDWQWTTDVPEGGDGGAMWAESSPFEGDCIVGSDDQSGVQYLTSPPIRIPTGDAPVLAFDHWIATERVIDGGNLSISVNGGDFELIPDEAFLFNDYNSTLRTTSQGNTNPKAGEPAFTGSDWGTARGSWGQSQVDLSSLAGAGDDIQIRFEFGQDGCVGAFGWYIDNVEVRNNGGALHRPGGRRLASTD
jgi:Zn-dependent metalloprotease